MRIRIWGARGASIVAATAALSLAGATAASAHHCYKTEWQEAAYAHLSQGGTAWMPLSDLGRMIISYGDEELGLEPRPECAEHLSLEPWMEQKELDREPLIHSRATIGGGAFHMKQKRPGSIDYLSESDFVALTELLHDAVAECDAAAAG